MSQHSAYFRQSSRDGIIRGSNLELRGMVACQIWIADVDKAYVDVSYSPRPFRIHIPFMFAN